MAVLIDPPSWPAHGRAWSHLVSDLSLDELHGFARAQGIPARGFEGDHYDVPEERYDDLIRAGALPVASRELLRRLQSSGLRRPKRRGERVLGSVWLGASRADVIRSRLAPPRPAHDLTPIVVTSRGLLAAGSGGLPVLRLPGGAVPDGALPDGAAPEGAAVLGDLVDGAAPDGDVTAARSLLDGAWERFGHLRITSSAGSRPWYRSLLLLDLRSAGAGAPTVAAPPRTTWRAASAIARDDPLAAILVESLDPAHPAERVASGRAARGGTEGDRSERDRPERDRPEHDRPEHDQAERDRTGRDQAPAG